MKYKILNYIKTLSHNNKIQILLVETISNILLKQDNFENFIQKNETKIIHIRDWIASVIENNEEWKTPRVLTIDALNNSADKYFEKKNQKIKTIELDENHEKLISNLDDYYIVQMLTPQALDNESKIMQHCIGYGGYDKKLLDNNYQYLSLRDKFNKAHVTLEIENNKVLQLQGKQNKIPENKYLIILSKWLFNNNYKLILSKYDIALNQQDNKIYSIYELPENCIINDDLDLRNKKIKTLPNNLIVNGDLNLNYTLLDKLPNNLNIKNDLLLQGTKIKNLPLDIKIGKNLNLSDSNIEIFHDNFIINGNLNLENCNEIIELPNNLIINGSLILNNTNIKKIPENIYIKENLLLYNTTIEELPDNLVVNGNLDLGCNNKLKTLPKNLTVNGNLNLIRTEIKEIPEDIKFLNKISIAYSKIIKLPDNLCFKHIEIDSKQINILKESMNFDSVIIGYNDIYTKKQFFQKFNNDKIAFCEKTI